MITQLCFPQFITHVSISLGAQLRFLQTFCADCFGGEKAGCPVGHCWGARARGRRVPPLGNARLSCVIAGWLGPVFIYLLADFLTYFSGIFVGQIKNRFIYELVNFQGGTLTLKWTCEKPTEKQVPAALIMRTDKAALLGLFMTFCLC